jgi:RHS repeat-associated protein
MTYRPVDDTTGWTQVWNGENRMVETYKGDDRLEFKYDYMGRRVEKKVYDGQTLTTHLKFVYDGFKLVEELDGLNADAPLHRYAWQPDDVGLDVVLQMTDVPNAAHSFHLHDANKNVMQMTDSSGALQENYTYAPFGSSIGAALTHVGFSSEFAENALGLVFYNYRYIMPKIGRWSKRDIIEEIGGINMYNFCSNSPVNNSDSLGNEIKIIDHKPGSIVNNYIQERRRRKLLVRETTLEYLRTYHAFEVQYAPPPQCVCKDEDGGTTIGIVALSQRVKKGYWSWDDDNFTPEGTRICCKDGKKIKVKSLPKYLSNDLGITGSQPGSYIDVPSGRTNIIRTFLVQAICVCPCEDDKVLEEKQFDWDPLHGNRSELIEW